MKHAVFHLADTSLSQHAPSLQSPADE